MIEESLIRKFYAIDDALMLENVDGAIEITEQQYNDALVAKMEGRKAFVRNAELVIFSGVMVTAWNKSTGHPEEFDEFDIIPEEYTLTEPLGDVVWGETGWIERIKSEQEIAMIEHQWVISELERVSIQLMYHWTEDSRSTHTIDEWKAYARQLRDYTSTNDAGVPVVIGISRPVIGN